MAKSVFTDAYSKLIDAVVSARRAAGVTQTELARRLGKPQSFVSRIEGGERRLDVIEYCAVVAALGEDPAELLRLVLGDLPQPPTI